MPAVLDRLRMPIGSLVVDIGLVVYLAFTAGQMTNRFEVMDRRVLAVEATQARENIPQRTAILENRAALYDRDRGEILDSLRRIEEKLDNKADKER